MSNPTLLRLKRVSDVLTPVSLGVSAACLMVSCVSIYRSGEFTREIVAAEFSGIALPCWLSLGLVAAGLVLDLLLPRQKEKTLAGRQTALVLSRLEAKTDPDRCEESLRSAIAAQQRIRRRLTLLRSLTLAVCALVFLVYALNAGNFHTSQINASMIRAMTVLLPCLTASGAITLVTEHLGNASMEAEIALRRQAPTRSPADRGKAETQPWKKLSALRTVILAAAIGLLLFGFFTGGTADVLTKAVNICTECVGLG